MSITDATRWATRWRWITGKGRKSKSAAEPGALLGHAEDGGEVRWPEPSPERASHGVVLAASGAGKTVLMANSLVQEFIAAAAGPADSRPAQFIIDPKGDLVAAVLQALAAEAPALLDRVRILDPFDQEGGFPFNLCRMPLGSTPVDIRAMQLAGLVATVSTATGEQSHLGVGARQLDVLQHVLLGALAATRPEASVLWALDALTEQKGLQRLAAVTGSERARRFLTGTKIADELRVSCASRLRTAFAASEHLERLVVAASCVSWGDLFAPGFITLADLARPPGGLIALQSHWANVLVRLAIDHLLERPSPWKGHHVRVVIDEAQIVAPVLSSVAETLLTTGRSRGVSLVALSQGTTLIRDASETLLRVLLTNAPMKIVGRLSAADAELLARELAPKKGSETSISAKRQNFVAAVTNLEDRSFFRLVPGAQVRFRSSDVDMASWNAAETRNADKLLTLRRRLVVPQGGSRMTLEEATAEQNRAPTRARGGRRRKSPETAEPQVTKDPESESTDEQPMPPRKGPHSRWG